MANQYANNDMNTEALNTYQVIVKNKMFNNAGDVMTSVSTWHSLSSIDRAITRVSWDNLRNKVLNHMPGEPEY